MKKNFGESLEQTPCCEHSKGQCQEPDEMEKAWNLMIECVRINDIPTSVACGAFLELAALAAWKLAQPYKKFCEMVDDAKISWESYWQ